MLWLRKSDSTEPVVVSTELSQVVRLAAAGSGYCGTLTQTRQIILRGEDNFGDPRANPAEKTLNSKLVQLLILASQTCGCVGAVSFRASLIEHESGHISKQTQPIDEETPIAGGLTHSST